MPRQSKYGNMPESPNLYAKVKGDAGLYKVWGIDWMNHTVFINRAGLEWVSIEKVAFEPEKTIQEG